MLVLDQQRIDRNAKGALQEAYAHECASWASSQLANARVIEDVNLSPINPERQMGRLYATCQRLEEELRLASPNFVFEPVVKNPTKKRLSYRLPGGTLDQLGLYESGVTPEWSVMTASYRWEPDPQYALGALRIERSDLRAVPVSLQEANDLLKTYGPQGARQELLRRRQDNHDPNVRPGFIRVLEVVREAIRGWRTVLVRPLQAGYLTLSQVQAIARNLGGTEERANWARATGKTQVAATI